MSVLLGKNISIPSEERERARCGRLRLPYVNCGLRFLVMLATFVLPAVCASAYDIVAALICSLAATWLERCLYVRESWTYLGREC